MPEDGRARWLALAQKVRARKREADDGTVVQDCEITLLGSVAFGLSATMFGEITINPFGPKHPDYQEMSVLDQTTPKGEGADAWHTDYSYLPRPPELAIARLVALLSLSCALLLEEFIFGGLFHLLRPMR